MNVLHTRIHLIEVVSAMKVEFVLKFELLVKSKYMLNWIGIDFHLANHINIEWRFVTKRAHYANSKKSERKEKKNPADEHWLCTEALFDYYWCGLISEMTKIVMLFKDRFLIPHSFSFLFACTFVCIAKIIFCLFLFFFLNTTIIKGNFKIFLLLYYQYLVNNHYFMSKWWKK